MVVVRIAVFVISSILALGVTSARADSTLLDRWYTALFDVDRAAISDLLADNAVIKLEDLGISQTKAEFISSLDEWEEIAQNANFAWQLDPEAVADATQATALVCYQFPDNELMIREVFSFADAKIVSSVQTTVAESCDDF